MNFKQRLRRLEAIAHHRLAAAAARASLPLEEPQTLEELRGLDAGSLTDMCMDLIQGRQRPDTEEFRQYYGYYRRMSFLQLARLFPRLKHRRRQLQAAQEQKLAARQAHARQELARPEPDLAAGCAYDDHYRQAILFRRLLFSLCWQ